MGRKISVSILENNGACDPGIRAFRQAFGEETVFSPTQEIAEKIASDDAMDVTWAADELTEHEYGTCLGNSVRASVPYDLWDKINEVENKEYGEYSEEWDSWTSLAPEKREKTLRPKWEPSAELVTLRKQANVLRAMAFLKIYEEHGIGEKVEESTPDMTGHAGPFDVPPDDDSAKQWSVTDDFVDPNKQPASDQASD